MTTDNHPKKKCALISTMDIIGGKWKLPILWYLAQSPQRYNQLKRCINGITNTMLTRSLRDLEHDGLIERIQHEIIPPQVEYRITKCGKAILPAVQIIVQWGEEKMNEYD